MGLTCSECGMEVMEGDAFCGECGAQVVEASVERAPVEPAPESIAPPPPATPEVPAQQVQQSCPNCRRLVEEGERFCPWCGVQVAGTAVPGAEQGPGAQPGNEGKVGAVLSQGGGELSERFSSAWNNVLMRAPLIFLGIMTVGFLVPIASLNLSSDDLGSGSGSVTLSDVTGISIILLLLLSVVLLGLLVAYASSPGLGGWPVLTVAGASFLLAVTAILLTIITLAVGAAVPTIVDAVNDGVDTTDDLFGSSSSDDLFGEDSGSSSLNASLSVGFGGILFLIGSVGLFITTLRLYTRES